MSDLLIEIEVRGQLLAADLVSGLSARARGQRGQATVEWLALMVGFAALITLLAGMDVWQRAGDEIVRAVDGILHKPAANEKV